jgi:hypothetical protein
LTSKRNFKKNLNKGKNISSRLKKLTHDIIIDGSPVFIARKLGAGAQGEVYSATLNKCEVVAKLTFQKNKYKDITKELAVGQDLLHRIADAKKNGSQPESIMAGANNLVLAYDGLEGSVMDIRRWRRSVFLWRARKSKKLSALVDA